MRAGGPDAGVCHRLRESGCCCDTTSSKGGRGTVAEVLRFREMTIATIAAPKERNRRAVRAQCAHLLLSLLLLVLCREATAIPNLRGVASQDEKYYQTAIIKCKDGSKSFAQERLNDDFCDCVDGTDEPGTNACPNGKFFCKNLGHKSSLLFSSRVNDGICDCCDGSDEYDGKVKCPNTCRESGKQSSEKLKKKILTFKEGVIIRNRDIENAKKQRANFETELVSLKKEQKIVKDIVAKLQVEKGAVEKQEREEKEKERREKEEQEKRLKREMEEKEKREKDEQERKEKESAVGKEFAVEKESAMEKANPDQAEDAQSEVEVPPQEDDVAPEDTDVEGLTHLTEAERGRIVASRWTGEDVSDIISNDLHHDHNTDDEDGDGDGDSDGDGDGDDDDVDNDDDLIEMHENNEDHDYDTSRFTSSDSSNSEWTGDEDSSSWWSKLSSFPEYFLQLFGLNRAPVDKSEAERIRKEYQESNDHLKILERSIDDMEKRAKGDFGKDGEFYVFYDSCFELKDKKYTYTVCPYNDANQKEAHGLTRLGRWHGFKEDYKEMIFQNGDKCWNGPERSLRVKMRCGTKLELRSVEEPSRCEYVGEFSTPALCTPEKLKALELQLLQNDFESVPHHEEL